MRVREVELVGAEREREESQQPGPFRVQRFMVIRVDPFCYCGDAQQTAHEKGRGGFSRAVDACCVSGVYAAVPGVQTQIEQETGRATSTNDDDDDKKKSAGMPSNTTHLATAVAPSHPPSSASPLNHASLLSPSLLPGLALIQDAGRREHRDEPHLGHLPKLHPEVVVHVPYERRNERGANGQRRRAGRTTRAVNRAKEAGRILF